MGPYDPLLLLSRAGIAFGRAVASNKFLQVFTSFYTGDVGASEAGFSEGSCSGIVGKAELGKAELDKELDAELDAERGSSPILFWRLGREGEGAYRDALRSCSSFPRSEMRYFSRIARSATTCLNSDSM
jgi:hypothetical protein